jgi:hypothetical protein
MNRVQEGLRNPTDACHTKASSKKQKGLIGRMSTNQPKTCYASGSWTGGAPWETRPASLRCYLGSWGPGRAPTHFVKVTPGGPAGMLICR